MGTSKNEHLISTTDGVTIFDRATLSEANSLVRVSNLGEGSFELGAGVNVYADVTNKSATTLLRSQSHVYGGVTAAGSLVEQDNVAIDGPVVSPSEVSNEVTRWQVNWPQGATNDISLPPDAPNTPIEPGAYDSVQAFSRAALTFKTGTYYINSLIIEPQVRFNVDASAGPVFVYVRDTLRLNTGLSYVAGERGQLLFGYPGNQAVTFEEAIVAAVVAPNATIELRRPASELPHEGSFFGKRVHVFSDAAVRHIPFEFNFSCLSGAGGTEQNCTPLPPGTASQPLSSTLYFPRGTQVDTVAVAARGTLSVGAGVESGLSEALFSSGEGSISIAADAAVPGLRAVQDVSVGEAATVFGSAEAGGTVTLGSGAAVAGQTVNQAALSPADTYPVEFLFRAPFDGDYVVHSGLSRVLLPGDYGDVTVQSSGKLYLTDGSYTFRRLDFQDGSQLQVNSREGWVELNVLTSLIFKAEVSVLGVHDVQLSVLYAGSTDVAVDGAFQGVLIAPSASVVIEGGEHSARFYGSEVEVRSGTVLKTPVSKWGKPLPFYRDPQVSKPVFSRPAAQQPASADSSGPTVIGGEGERVKFPITERIPVLEGNAGEGSVTIVLSDGGNTITCEYEGRSNTNSPTSLLELALGREFWFVSCDNGSVPGDVIEADSVEILVVGASNSPATAITVPTSTCNNVLPTPIPAGESREMVSDHEWPSSFLELSWFLVDETYGGSTPALYYANFYITDKTQLDLLDSLLIHWSDMPILPEDWPSDWDSLCGTIHFENDGEGTWVFGVIPGAIYNALMAAKVNSGIEADDRAMIPPMVLREIPQEMRSSVGSFRLSALDEAGFRYLNLDELPDDAALDAMLEGKGSAAALKGLLEAVGNTVRNAVRAVRIVWGFLDRRYGTVDVDLDIDVLNTDGRFVDPQTHEPLRMSRAWTSGNQELALGRARVSIYQIPIRIDDPAPITVEYRGQLDTSGQVRIKVAKDAPTALDGTVAHKKVCVTLNNDAAQLTSFVTPSRFCYKDLSDADFDHFANDSSVDLPLEHWHLSTLAEATDAHNYVATIIGRRLGKAQITVGSAAEILDGPDNAAYAPSFGYASALPDVVAALSLITGTFSPLTSLSAGYTAVAASTDIIIGPRNHARLSRGLTTHEYGHYAFVGLMRELGDGYDERTALTWDTIRAGTGNPSLDEDVRIINEGFADFFAGQVASATDYFSPSGSDKSDAIKKDDDGNSLPNRMWPSWIVDEEDAGLALMVRAPGLDRNYWNKNQTAELSIGRVSTLLHDLFDGRPLGDLGPTSATAWAYSSPSGTIRHASGLPKRASPLDFSTASEKLYLVDPGTGLAFIAERDPDNVDNENFVLPGSDILELLEEFIEARESLPPENGTSYSVRAMERAVGSLAVERGSWCSACILAAPHFAEFSSSADNLDLRIECLGNGEILDALGDPPTNIDRVSASCAQCPPFEGMNLSTGACEPCLVDEVIDWSVDGGECSIVTRGISEAADDNCQETFVVEVETLPPSDPHLRAIWKTALNESEEACEQAMVDWRVSVDDASGVTTSLFPGSSAGQWTNCDGVCPLACNLSNSQVALSATSFPSSGTMRIELEGHEIPGLQLSLSNSHNDCSIVR